MTKRCLCALLLLALCLCAVGQAESAIPRAATEADLTALAKYASFARNETTGEWSVDDPRFEAVCDAVAAGEARGGLVAGVAMWQLRMSGNARTSELRPTLEFWLLRGEPIGARAVSVVANGARWDFEATCEAGELRGVRAERLTIALNDQSLACLADMAASESLVILVHGDDTTFSTTVTRGDTGHARKRLESACMDCITLRGAFDSLGVQQYALWDIAAAQTEQGQTALWTRTELGSAGAYSAYLTGESELMYTGARGEGLTALADALEAAGLLAGARETIYGAKTTAAVARAQKLYGLPVTGAADAALFTVLSGGQTPSDTPVAEQADQAQALSTARVSLNRWWTACEAAAIGNHLSSITAADSGNRLVICEGDIQNMDLADLGLGWQLTGKVTLDGKYEYACVLRAESAQGDGFTTTLLPLAKARLIVAAEIPAEAAAGASSLAVSLALNGERLEWSLTK